MGREIIFRGKRVDNGEWVYGSLISLTQGEFIVSTDHYNTVDIDLHKKLLCNALWEYNDFDEVNPKTVGQYTGLTDKNGKKIFEGDIVRYTVGYDYGGLFFPPEKEEDYARLYNKQKRIEQVVYCEGRFTPRPDICDTDSDEVVIYYDFEIIGNIHDNPELLK